MYCSVWWIKEWISIHLKHFITAFHTFADSAWGNYPQFIGAGMSEWGNQRPSPNAQKTNTVHKSNWIFIINFYPLCITWASRMLKPGSASVNFHGLVKKKKNMTQRILNPQWSKTHCWVLRFFLEAFSSQRSSIFLHCHIVLFSSKSQSQLLCCYVISNVFFLLLLLNWYCAGCRSEICSNTLSWIHTHHHDPADPVSKQGAGEKHTHTEDIFYNSLDVSLSIQSF